VSFFSLPVPVPPPLGFWCTGAPPRVQAKAPSYSPAFARAPTLWGPTRPRKPRPEAGSRAKWLPPVKPGRSLPKPVFFWGPASPSSPCDHDLPLVKPGRPPEAGLPTPPGSSNKPFSSCGLFPGCRDGPNQEWKTSAPPSRQIESPLAPPKIAGPGGGNLPPVFPPAQSLCPEGLRRTVPRGVGRRLPSNS